MERMIEGRPTSAGSLRSLTKLLHPVYPLFTDGDFFCDRTLSALVPGFQTPEGGKGSPMERFLVDLPALFIPCPPFHSCYGRYGAF